MEQKYLLDTNVILDFMGNKLPVKSHKAISVIIDVEINLSAINKMELLGFSKVEHDLIDFVNYANILPINDSVVDKTIEIRSLYKIKLPDAIISATALINNLVLISHNEKDFKTIHGLHFINSYHI